MLKYLSSAFLGRQAVRSSVEQAAARRLTGWRLIGWRPMIAGIGLACVLAGLTPSPARADGDDGPKAAPRSVIEIGQVSVVLIAAKERLFAFIDRLEDNLPEAQAELALTTGDGTALALNEAATGLFTAPFKHDGHGYDTFLVALKSADGTGSATAKIVYEEGAATEGASEKSGFAAKLAIAIVAGGIGMLFGMMLLLWWRGGWQWSAGRRLMQAAAVVRDRTLGD
jgi:hypothetical protein